MQKQQAAYHLSPFLVVVVVVGQYYSFTIIPGLNFHLKTESTILDCRGHWGRLPWGTDALATENNNAVPLMKVKATIPWG